MQQNLVERTSLLCDANELQIKQCMQIELKRDFVSYITD